MRILVTGATGFIGSNFVDRCLAGGHTVTALVRPGAVPAARARWQSQDVAIVTGDLLDPASLLAASQDAECVGHFAAAFREAGADDAYFHKLNVAGTRHLAQAAAAAGVRRFVLCGTAGIYGKRIDGVIDENWPVHPWNIYEITKLAAEQQLREVAQLHGLEYVILRPSAVYGPGDQRLLKLFRSAAKGRFPLFGRGQGRRHMIHVHDLVDAFLLACETPSAAGAELIAAGPRATTLRELLDTLAQVLGRSYAGPRLPLAPMQMLAAVTEDTCSMLKLSPPLYRRRMDFYINDVEYDCSRAEQALGWIPRIELEPGLAGTLAAYREAGLV